MLASLLQESVFATLTGTLLALVFALVFIDGFTVPFSIGTFTLTLTPPVLVLGLLGGLGLGVAGALPPAWACLWPPIPVALRSS